MITAELTTQIDDVIGNTSMAASEKVQLLKELARAYWRVVFPELDTPLFDRLTPEQQEERWRLVRARNELVGTKNPEEIKLVLDWPATGRPFHWLK
jgi:hypothetical protein